MNVSMKNPIMLLFVSLFAVGVSAQTEKELFDMSLEELMSLDVSVSIASKKEERVLDAPGIITVVTKEEIKSYGGNSLVDVLNRLPSVQLTWSDVFRDNVPGIRGQIATQYDNRILLLLNGRPMRESMTGGFHYDIYHSFPLEAIERIEVIRGPGSVLYGSSAFMGVINIVTKKPKDTTEGSVMVLGGSLETAGGSVTFGSQINNGPSIYGAYNKFSTSGPEWEFRGSDGLNSHKFDINAEAILITGSYKNLSLNLYHDKSEGFSLGGGTRWAAAKNQLHETSLIDLGYKVELTDVSSLNLNMTYNRHYWNYEDGYVNDMLGEINFRTSIDKLNLLIGSTVDYHDYKAEVITANKVTWNNIYSQLDYKVLEKLKLIGGLQWNKVEGIDDNYSPRVGGIYELSKNAVVKLLYSEAFRAAYGHETSFTHPAVIGNPDLNPETIKTAEAQILAEYSKTRVGATIYYSKIENIIGRITGVGGQATYTNAGTHDYKGVELEGAFALNNWLHLNTSFLYQTNETPTNSDSPAYAPNTIFKLGLTGINGPAKWGIFNSYFAEPTQVEDVTGTTPAQINEKAAAYNLLSANLLLDLNQIFGYKNGNDLSLILFVDNVLDESIWFPSYARSNISSLPQHSGRAYYAKLQMKF